MEKYQHHVSKNVRNIKHFQHLLNTFKCIFFYFSLPQQITGRQVVFQDQCCYLLVTKSVFFFFSQVFLLYFKFLLKRVLYNSKLPFLILFFICEKESCELIWWTMEYSLQWGTDKTGDRTQTSSNSAPLPLAYFVQLFHGWVWAQLETNSPIWNIMETFSGYLMRQHDMDVVLFKKDSCQWLAAREHRCSAE